MAVALPPGRFTVEEYYRLAEIGIIREDDRVELLDGEIVEMSPIGPPHATCVNRLTALLVRAAGERAVVSVQNPAILSRWSAPQPDLALCRPPAGWKKDSLPTAGDTLLVIEVADSSLVHDRTRKLPLYARSGVPEVWLVNLTSDSIEQYAQPGPEGYGEVRIARRGDTIAPLLLPDVILRVDEILG